MKYKEKNRKRERTKERMKKNVRRGRYWWTSADVYSDQVIRGK